MHWNQMLQAWNGHCNKIEITIGALVKCKKEREMKMNTHLNKSHLYHLNGWLLWGDR